MAHIDNSYHYFLMVIAILGTILRLAFINQPISYDEAITFEHSVSLPLTESLTTYGDPNNHFLNTLLAHIAIEISGSIALWVWRFPAFVAGVLLIPAVFRTTARLFDPQVALIASGLVAIAPQLVLYSSNARGYSIVVLCFVLLLGLAQDMRKQADLRRQSNQRQWVWFVLVTAIGCYAIPAMLYPFAVVVGWLLLSIIVEYTGPVRLRLLRDLVLACVAAGLLTMLLYLPALINGNWRGLTRTQELAPFLETIPDLLDRLWRIWTYGVHPLLVGVVVIGVLIGLVVGRGLSAHRVPLLATAVVIMTVVLLVQRPLFISSKSRVLLFLLPLFLMVAAAGLATMIRWAVKSPSWQRVIVPLLVLALVVGGSLHIIAEQPFHESNEGGSFRDGEPVALYLGTILQPDDAILCHGPCDFILRYYFQQHGIDATVFDADVDQAPRVVIVMNNHQFLDFRSETPVEELILYRLAPETQMLMSDVELMRRFPSAEVYLIRRENAVPSGS